MASSEDENCLSSPSNKLASCKSDPKFLLQGPQSQSVSLVSYFQDYLVNGTFTDMSVSIVQASVKYTIRCHQAVLASASKFLGIY